MAEGAEVLQVKVQLDVSSHLRLVRHRLATSLTSVRAWGTLLLAF